MKKSVKKLAVKRILCMLLTTAMFLSGIEMTAFAAETEATVATTTFTFDGDTVIVEEGDDKNYEVAIYDDTDTETELVPSTDEDGNITYSLPDGSKGELLVSIKKKAAHIYFREVEMEALP